MKKIKCSYIYKVNDYATYHDCKNISNNDIYCYPDLPSCVAAISSYSPLCIIRKRNVIADMIFGCLINNHSLCLPITQLKHVKHVLGTHLFEIKLHIDDANVQHLQKISFSDFCNICIAVPIDVKLIPEIEITDVKCLYTFLESNWMVLNEKYVFDIPI